MLKQKATSTMEAFKGFFVAFLMTAGAIGSIIGYSINNRENIAIYFTLLAVCLIVLLFLAIILRKLWIDQLSIAEEMKDV